MKKLLGFLIFVLPAIGFGQSWNSTTVPTTVSDYNTSTQLTYTGYGGHHGILFNAHRSATLSNNFLWALGNTKHAFNNDYGSGAGAIMYLGNGGRMDFLISNASAGAGQDVNWGAPKMTITRTGVGVGADDPGSPFEVRRQDVATGQTVDVANFTFAGQNHFDQPGVFSEGRIVLGSKAYGNGILKRAMIGFSTSPTWRGGMLKFYTTPDNDTWVPLPRMVINQNGHVGIGTDAPRGRLDVDGSGDIYLADETVSGSYQSIYLPGHIYIAPYQGSNFSYIQARRENNSGSSAMVLRTMNNSSLVEAVIIQPNGHVGIGTFDVDEALTVKGKIHTREVRVDLQPNVAPDYVFESDYNLLPLEQIESYIKANKHLPEVPSAKQMEAEGMNLKEMNLILLKKVEELTLHAIAANHEKEAMALEVDKLKKDIEALQKLVIEKLK